jgi:hypothetical protein
MNILPLVLVGGAALYFFKDSIFGNGEDDSDAEDMAKAGALTGTPEEIAKAMKKTADNVAAQLELEEVEKKRKEAVAQAKKEGYKCPECTASQIFYENTFGKVDPKCDPCSVNEYYEKTKNYYFPPSMDGIVEPSTATA